MFNKKNAKNQMGHLYSQPKAKQNTYVSGQNSFTSQPDDVNQGSPRG